MERILATVVSVLSAVCLTGAAPREAADLVLRHGAIVTLDQQNPRAEALAIRSDRIVAVGSNEVIKRHIGEETTVIELHGQLAVPGFIEGHGHFMSLGRTKMQVDLTRARTWTEIVRLIADKAATTKPGEWIVGRGWHQEKWAQPPKHSQGGYPTHAALSYATPENPVLLVHASGHMCLANQRAMSAARIDENSRDPAGGTILRDSRGRPTGVFRETAQDAVWSAYSKALARRTPAQVETDRKQAFDLAARECLSKGVTSFQDAGSSFETVDFFRRLADEKKLGVRLWVMLRAGNRQLRVRLAEYRMIDYGGHRLTVRAIKQMADGALGSHGAWLLEPYRDLPASKGLNVTSLESIKATALLAIKHDYQLCTHAIGDRANREILNLFQLIFRSFPDGRDRRWRIEHAQHLHPADIPRFAELGVIASMQASHCTSDAPYVVERLGRDRAQVGAYAWRSLLDQGAIVTNGTDTPVEDVNPLTSFHAAVTRRMANGETFFPEQRMTRLEALKSYTLDAAYAAFEENSKGSLSPGKLADIVVLSRDILSCPENEILDTRVTHTILGGKLVYTKQSDPP